MTHDEVRQAMREMMLKLAPGLATATLKADIELSRELAIRVDSIVRLLELYDVESEANPKTDGLVLLKSLQGRLARAEAVEEAVKGVSVWELLRKPTV
jgi:hypothetical protein